MEQYPHTIKLSWTARGLQFNELTGDYKQASDKQEFTSNCRIEGNSSNRVIHGVDGSAIEYSSTVYLPSLDFEIPDGADYELTNKVSAMKGKVIHASNGQLNTRIWL